MDLSGGTIVLLGLQTWMYVFLLCQLSRTHLLLVYFYFPIYNMVFPQ